MIWSHVRKTAIILSLFGLPHSPKASAVSEESLPRELSGQIEPFFAASTLEKFEGQDGKTIALRRFVNPKTSRVVLLVPGYSESLNKYAEVVYDLYKAGYSVVIYDHRGQGFSTRLLSDPKPAHIDQFDYLVRDLHSIGQKILIQFTGPKFVLAHSMGAAVVLRELETSGVKVFDAVVLTAPMVKMQITPMVQIILPWVLAPLSKLGFNDFYVRGPKDPATFTFADNLVTHSEVRFNLLQQRSVERTPEAQVWGMTAGWLHQALKGTVEVRADASKIVTPLLILQSDSDDFVNPTAQVELCVQIQSCRLEKLKDSKHEILMETDSVRTPAMNVIFDFFNAHSR